MAMTQGGFAMKKALAALAAAVLLLISFAGVAGAQDSVIGTVVSDPATVPEAGEHTVTATGSGYLPDSDLLLGSCTSPAAELVPGVSTPEEITAAAGEISPIVHCDLATALSITTDGDGGFSQEVTANIGPNFFLSAGALDQSQAGAVWIPIVDPDAPALAATGANSSTFALLGAALLAMGFVAVSGARRFER